MVSAQEVILNGELPADEERVRRGRALLLDERSHQELAETFRALADATRAKIVYSLLLQELSTTDLATIIGTSESAVSQHLRTLRQLRLVKARRSGKLVFYSLDDDHVRLLLSIALSHIRDGGSQRVKIDEVLDLMGEYATHEEGSVTNGDQE